MPSKSLAPSCWGFVGTTRIGVSPCMASSSAFKFSSSLKKSGVIINGYKNIFLENSNPDKFQEGTTFEAIFTLYELDSRLRNTTMIAMQNIEANLRTIVAYTIAENFGYLESDYLVRTNYKDGKKYSDGTYKLDQLLNKFSKIINDDTQPFKHYREVHGNCPPWILLKGTTFGNLINFIKLQKSEIKRIIISRFFGIPVDIIKQNDDLTILFMDMLFLFRAYRNRAAHGGRIFNYRPNEAHIRYTTLIHPQIEITTTDYKKGYGKNDWAILISCSALIDNKIPLLNLKSTLEEFVNTFSKVYPNKEERLLHEMNIKSSFFIKR